MLDINKIADNISNVKELLKYRTDTVELDEALSINMQRKTTQIKLDELKNHRNIISKEIAMKKAEKDSAVDNLLQEADLLKEKIATLEIIQRDLENDLHHILDKIPNIPMEDVPIGPDETKNLILYEIGIPRNFSFEQLSHIDILTNLKMWQPERATKIAGRGFPVLCNDGAMLELALVNFMLDHNMSYGFEPIWLPFVVTNHSLYGTGQLPKFSDDQFKIADADLYLNPTAEVALTNMYREDIIDLDVLPIHFTAYSPSFRKEAGSYGKDNKGLIRVHQFNKVEIVTICKPEDSEFEHEKMRSVSEDILKKLDIPYRVVKLSQGDTGFSAAKTYDIEVWLPSTGEYREIASISNCLDFQARRAHIRYKPEGSKKTQFVHTLNGSALAVGRTMVAILENYQQEDGSVIIPEVLRPYFKKDCITTYR